MQVHLLPQGPPSLPGVYELPGKLVAEADVVGASAPFPVSHPGRRARGVGPSPGLVAVIAGAGLYAALATGPGDGVGHRRAGDGVDERRLSATCKTTEGELWRLMRDVG